MTCPVQYRLKAVSCNQSCWEGGGALRSVSCSCPSVAYTARKTPHLPSLATISYTGRTACSCFHRLPELYADKISYFKQCMLPNQLCMGRSKLCTAVCLYYPAEKAKNIQPQHELVCHLFVDLMKLTYIIVY